MIGIGEFEIWRKNGLDCSPEAVLDVCGWPNGKFEMSRKLDTTL